MLFFYGLHENISKVTKMTYLMRWRLEFYQKKSLQTRI